MKESHELSKIRSSLSDNCLGLIFNFQINMLLLDKVCKMLSVIVKSCHHKDCHRMSLDKVFDKNSLVSAI